MTNVFAMRLFLVSFPTSIVILSMFALLGVALSTTLTPALSQPSNFNHYSLNDQPLGKPYGYWLTKFWDWWGNVGIDDTPTSKDYPCYHSSLENSTANGVIFLVDVLTIGRNVQYDCTIPANQSLLIPLVESEYDTGTQSYEHASDQTLLDAATALDNGPSFVVKIDGTEVPKQFIDRVQSPFWNATWKDKNQFESKPGAFRAVAEGFWLFLKPLSPGMHTISYSASSPKYSGNVPIGATEGSATYKVFVNSSKASEK